ncbi:MAG: PiT family inorganic phosphate transporter [Chitinophagales bacterium]|nr:inorganic phosphate transporter [Bacteroidota bacterium]
MEFVIIIIVLALLFDYINGFHDAANSIATIVSTKVLTPFQAVIWAAFFNFVAFLIFKDHAVANTIGKTVNENFITLPVIFAGLIAAIIWNLLTWWYGIPSSSSHTLIGGFAGAAITHAFIERGFLPLHLIIDSDSILKIIAFIFLAPVIGMIISTFYTLVMMQRVTWVKCLVLLLTCVGIWFTFIHFQEKKIDKNVEKFFNVTSYAKDVENLDKVKEKQENERRFTEANDNAHKAFEYVKLYESKGSDVVADKIIQHVDMDFITSTRIIDNIELFFKVKQLEVLSHKDSKHLQAYHIAKKAVDDLRPIAMQHQALGYDKMVEMMLAKAPIQPFQIEEFDKVVRVDIKKDLKKVIERGDNKIIRYGLITMLLILVASFIYSEIIKEPSAQRTANNYKKMQLLSSAAFSIGHGGNDAQKVMGIIAAALVANGNIVDLKAMPNWVPLSCYVAIALGTLSGGWKIVKTMGTKITKVTPLEGVCAETAGATTLFLTEQMGIPVSTTHTITGGIIGVGATKRLSAVRWGVTINLLWAWILTIPISALLAAITYFIVNLFV